MPCKSKEAMDVRCSCGALLARRLPSGEYEIQRNGFVYTVRVILKIWCRVCGAEMKYE